MKWRISILMVLGILGSCGSPMTSVQVMTPVVVGTKTADYEVVAPNALKLAPGRKFQIVDGPLGKNTAIVLLRPEGPNGGYMACGCVGAQTSSCETTSDNPDHPSCAGGCTDSEGNDHGCGMFGPIIGPPRDPFAIRLMSRPTNLSRPTN
jgi:hypothetical protein